jgi:hypothetical protein
MVYKEVTSVVSFPDAEKAGNQPVYLEIDAQFSNINQILE